MIPSATAKDQDKPADRRPESESMHHGQEGQEKDSSGDVRESAFKVPVGEAPNGSLVRARDAHPSIHYVCPRCGAALILRKGEVKSPHFAHQSHVFCSPDTALHIGVKAWIAKLLSKCLKGHKRGIPKIKVPCMGHHPFRSLDEHRPCDGDAWMSCADLQFDEVAVERSTTNGLRPDVLLLNKGVPILGIEVFVTHAVDGFKAARFTHPWIELKALHVLQSPRAWKPIQMRHPWANHCRTCLWANKIMKYNVFENDDPADYVAQLSASMLETFLLEWLPTSSKRIKPAVHWRCPWCKAPNRRDIRRDQMIDVSISSSLLPPCEPEVTIVTTKSAVISVIFGFPKNPNRPWAIVPMPMGLKPIIRATPALKHRHRIILNGTNRPFAFLCKKCCRDCLGTLPSPLFPIHAWEMASQDLGIK